jgi:hypothetical protein
MPKNSLACFDRDKSDSIRHGRSQRPGAARPILAE